MNAIFALANVVIKELYRRKDFYVLLFFTVVITLIMASANLFNEDKIVRFLKELCLLLIWISALVMAVGTAARQIPAERENRTIFPLAGQTGDAGACGGGKIPRLLAGLRHCAGGILRVLRGGHRLARAPMVFAQLRPGALDAMDVSGGGGFHGAARLHHFRRAFLQRQHLPRVGVGNSAGGTLPGRRYPCNTPSQSGPSSIRFTSSFPIWNGSTFARW